MTFLLKSNLIKLFHRIILSTLGVLIDENLSWDHHVKELSNKFSRANGIISKFRHYAPKSAVFYSHDAWLLCVVSHS